MHETLSLFELNNVVRSLIEQHLDGEYWLQAEMAEARLTANGHFYIEFVEKDQRGATVARARATMWARTYSLLAPLFERATGQHLRAGLKVRVLVSVSFHELYGYSLNIVNIDPTYTLGDILQRRRQILEQLRRDGIADDNRSLPLPRLLRRIAVVSSATAAGYGDFCDQLHHNAYGLAFTTRLFAATMQGTGTEESILAALEAILTDDGDGWDCAVIIRGGGATTDLADFDSYALAAAVAQMPMPVIVGIGHERDETVLDHVAHTSVKTPTAAAEFLIAHGAAELATIGDCQARITGAARRRVESAMQHLRALTAHLPTLVALRRERAHRHIDSLAQRIAAAPRRHIDGAAMRLQLTHARLAQATRLRLQAERLRLQAAELRAAALDPQRQLQRGYSITYDSTGRIITRATALRPGQTIVTRLADGTLTATVATVATPDTPTTNTQPGT